MGASSTIRNVAFLAFLAGAYASNPDEESFQRYLEQQLTRDGSHWIESKVASHLASNIYPRQNWYLFSLVKIPEDRVTYVGMFGSWFRWPTLLSPRKDSSSSSSTNVDNIKKGPE